MLAKIPRSVRPVHGRSHAGMGKEGASVPLEGRLASRRKAAKLGGSRLGLPTDLLTRGSFAGPHWRLRSRPPLSVTSVGQVVTVAFV